jgi:hypothetical protein
MLSNGDGSSPCDCAGVGFGHRVRSVLTSDSSQMSGFQRLLSILIRNADRVIPPPRMYTQGAAFTSMAELLLTSVREALIRMENRGLCACRTSTRSITRRIRMPKILLARIFAPLVARCSQTHARPAVVAVYIARQRYNASQCLVSWITGQVRTGTHLSG